LLSSPAGQTGSAFIKNWLEYNMAGNNNTLSSKLA